MKRPAASSSAPSKKQRGSGISKKITSISKAVKSSESFPTAVLDMLCENMELCLGFCKEERHEYQVQVVEMIQKVLGSVEASLQSSIEAAQKGVSEADAEKEKRAAELEAATQAVTAASEAQAAAEATEAEAAKKKGEAEKNLKSATAEQRSGDKTYEATHGRKTNLGLIMTHFFVPLKQQSLDASKAKEAVSAVCKLAKELAFDSALLTSMPSALGKAERGTFDQLVMTQVEEEMKKQTAECEAELEAGQKGVTERAEKVTACQQALDSTTAEHAATLASSTAAATAVKEANATEKVKKSSVKNYAADMKKVKAELEDATAEMGMLKEGPLADFKELAEKSIHPPEPVAPEPVAPEVSEPAAAPEA